MIVVVVAVPAVHGVVFVVVVAFVVAVVIGSKLDSVVLISSLCAFVFHLLFSIGSLQ